MTAEEPCGRVIYNPSPPHVCSPPLAEYTEQERDRRVVSGYPDDEFYVAEELGAIWECCCGELWVVGYRRWSFGRTWLRWEPQPYDRETAIRRRDWTPEIDEPQKKSRRWWNRRNR